MCVASLNMDIGGIGLIPLLRSVLCCIPRRPQSSQVNCLCATSTSDCADNNARMRYNQAIHNHIYKPKSVRSSWIILVLCCIDNWIEYVHVFELERLLTDLGRSTINSCKPQPGFLLPSSWHTDTIKICCGSDQHGKINSLKYSGIRF